MPSAQPMSMTVLWRSHGNECAIAMPVPRLIALIALAKPRSRSGSA